MKYILGLVGLVLLILLFKAATSEDKTEDEEVSKAKAEKLNNQITERSLSENRGKEASQKEIRRLTVSDSYKAEQEEKKKKFMGSVKQAVPRFRENKSMLDTIEALREISGIEIKLITASTGGYSFDDKYTPKSEESFKSKKYNFDLENMPSGEIVRYLAMASNLQYKIDLESQEILIADRGVILDKDFREQKVSTDFFKDIPQLGFYSQENGVPSTEDILMVKQSLEKRGVKFPAGSDISYENGEFIFTVPEKEQKSILEMIK